MSRDKRRTDYRSAAGHRSSLGDYTRRNGVSLRAGDLITFIVDVLPHHLSQESEGVGRPDAW
jgi:hypothetical protein